MIFAFTGKTGSSKTFLAVKMLYDYWRHGVDVYSNTPLLFLPEDVRALERNVDIETFPSLFTRFERFKNFVTGLCNKIFGLSYSPVTRGKVLYFQEITEVIHVRNAVIFFDEAQALFNARYWETLPPEFQYKLQQHRKHGLDMIATMQNMGTVDIAYRRLVQVWIHCENLFQIGGSPRIIFGLFRENHKDIDRLYNQVDDLIVPTLSTKLRIIHYYSNRLYDTMFDIGFKSFKMVWLSFGNEQRYLIIPKQMNLKEALREIKMLKDLKKIL